MKVGADVLIPVASQKWELDVLKEVKMQREKSRLEEYVDDFSSRVILSKRQASKNRTRAKANLQRMLLPLMEAPSNRVVTHVRQLREVHFRNRPRCQEKR